MKALIRAVFRKELRDHLRDRRSLASALAGPLLGPLLLAVMLTLMASWFRQDKPLELPVVGREHAPSLMAFLERYGAKLSEAPKDYEALIQAGKLDAVLVVPQDYAKDFTSGRTAEVQLVVDNSRNQARNTIRRARTLLSGYSGLLSSQRLFARGVAPELAMPVRVEEVDLSTPERMAATALNMIPIFLIFAAFMGGMHVAIDTTAGERERGSLEPLLLNPISRGALVVGKWLTTVLMACVAVFICLVAFLVVTRRVPLQDLGIKAYFDGPAVLGMLAAVLPLTLMSSALQMLLATYARSFKEAQTYLQLFQFVPTLPGMVLAISPVQSKLWMFGVPVLGQQVLVGEVMRGEVLGPLPYVLSALSCGVLSVVCLALTTRMLREERIIFGRG